MSTSDFENANSLKVSAREFLARLLARRAIPRLQRLGRTGGTLLPRFAVVATDLIGQAVVAEGLYERDDLAMMRQVLRRQGQGGIMIDVGANIGNHTLALSDLFDRVICYEPHPVTRLLLEANIALAGTRHVTVRPFALGDCAAEVTLRVVDPGNLGSARISDAGSDPGHNVSVRLGDTDLDEALGKDEAIRLVKLDIEGYEPRAIRGLMRHLRQHQPLVAFEALDANGMVQTRSALVDAGYTQFFRFSTDSGSQRLLRFLQRAVFGYRIRLDQLAPDDTRYASLVLAAPPKFEAG